MTRGNGQSQSRYGGVDLGFELLTSGACCKMIELGMNCDYTSVVAAFAVRCNITSAPLVPV